MLQTNVLAHGQEFPALLQPVKSIWTYGIVKKIYIYNVVQKFQSKILSIDKAL